MINWSDQYDGVCNFVKLGRDARRLVRWYIGMDEVKSEARMHGLYVSRDRREPKT